MLDETQLKTTSKFAKVSHESQRIVREIVALAMLTLAVVLLTTLLLEIINKQSNFIYYYKQFF